MNRLIFLLLFLFACRPSLTPEDIYKKYDIFAVDYRNAPGTVMITTGFGKSELCNGAAISQYSILTAAHCLYFPKEVLLIKYDCNSIEDKSCKQSIIHDIILHEDALVNDIAIIKTDYLNIGWLAEIPEFNIKPRGVFLTGYGLKPHGAVGKLFGMINKNVYYTDWLHRFSVDIERGKGFCFGDSGGPAYEFNGNKLIGILSKSFVEKQYAKNHKCGGLLKYVYVPYYRSWINSNMY